MSKSKRLHPVFGEKHKSYMAKAIRSEISVAEGAVRAGKTVDNVAAFARMLDLGVKDRIHLATGSTSANAKLNIGDCNGFGLEHIFRGRCSWTKYKGNDALRIKTAGKTYIVIFAGGGKADSFKKIRGNSYGMWIATEINLHHENTIQEAFNRQLAATTRRVFWDLNPSSPANWIYKKYIDTFEDAYGSEYNYEHFTIRDNATISAERLDKIERQYDKNSIWYKRDILGLRCNAKGLVYDMFRTDKHVISREEVKKVGLDTEWYLASDFGIQNATVFLAIGKMRDGRHVILDEYYYSGRDERRQRTVAEHVLGMAIMISSLRSTYGLQEAKRAIVDPSAAALIVELRKNGVKTWGADNDVINGIEDVKYMLKEMQLVVCEDCKHTIEEFGIYSWDEKASERGEDAPLKENDHCIVGDSLIKTFTGEKPIRELVGKRGFVWSYSRMLKIMIPMPFFDCRCTGRNADVFDITLEVGKKLRATGDHRVLTKEGYKPVNALNKDDLIICNTSTRKANIAKSVGIASIEKVGRADVYNMEVPFLHNFIANGIVIHNCMDSIRYYVKTRNLVKRDKTPHKVSSWRD